jgi:AraC-like DNA-binding protein
MKVKFKKEKEGSAKLANQIVNANIREYLPKGNLKKYVKSIFHFDFTSDSPIHEYQEMLPNADTDFFERIIPSGCCELIMQSEQGFSMMVPDIKQESFLPKNFITPVMQSYVKLKQSKKVKVFGVRLFPWATKSFLKNSAEYSHFDIIDADNCVAATAGKDIRENLFNVDFNQGFLLIEKWLEEYLGIHGEIDEVVNEAINVILFKKGMLEVDELFKISNLTPRRVEQRFIDCVGMCPKQYCRLIKFQNIFQTINKGKVKNLLDVVYECGYYDQSHLIRNFKEFTGIAPKKYFKEQNVISTFLTGTNSLSFILNSQNTG